MMKAGEKFIRWNETNSAELQRMWDVEGLSSGDIAYVMGTTRNAIIGRVRRMGLMLRDNVKTAPRIKPRQRHKPRRPTRPALKLLAVPLPGDTRPLLGSAWEPLPGVAPVSLVELEAGMCRWPIGETKPYQFCGAHADGSYCDYHQSISSGVGTAGERVAHNWKEAA
jgi:hypothetical protein